MKIQLQQSEEEKNRKENTTNLLNGLFSAVKGDKGQNVNIDWLTWGFRLMVGALILNAVALMFCFYKLL